MTKKVKLLAFPLEILLGKDEEGHLYPGTPEEIAAAIGDCETGRYRLVGDGVVNGYADYVENAK